MSHDSSSDEDRTSEDEAEEVARQLHTGTFERPFPGRNLEREISNVSREGKKKSPRCPFCSSKDLKDLKALEQHASSFNGDKHDRMKKRHRGLGQYLKEVASASGVARLGQTQHSPVASSHQCVKMEKELGEMEIQANEKSVAATMEVQQKEPAPTYALIDAAIERLEVYTGARQPQNEAHDQQLEVA